MMYLKMSLRDEGGEYQNGVYFLMPIIRIWWEDAVNDLHIQFKGYSGHNICPADNARDGEMFIPEDSLIARKWIENKLGRKITKHSTICSVMLVDWDSACESITAPKRVIDDLVKHWVTPN